MKTIPNEGGRWRWLPAGLACGWLLLAAPAPAAGEVLGNRLSNLRLVRQTADHTEAILVASYQYDGRSAPLVRLVPVIEKRGQPGVAQWFETHRVSVGRGKGFATFKVRYRPDAPGAPSTLVTDKVTVNMMVGERWVILGAPFLQTINWGLAATAARESNAVDPGLPELAGRSAYNPVRLRDRSTPSGQDCPRSDQFMVPIRLGEQVEASLEPPCRPPPPHPALSPGGGEGDLRPGEGVREINAREAVSENAPLELERRSPTRHVKVGISEHAGSETGAPMAGSKGAPREPRSGYSLPEQPDQAPPTERAVAFTEVPPTDASLAAAEAAGEPQETRLALSASAPAPRAAWQERLTLGPGDVLNLALFGEPELSREAVPVGPDGRISFLEAQDVLAAGRTIDELRAELDHALSQYRRVPRSVIMPVSFGSKKYFMLGAVVKKGVFTLDRPLTIVEAVARAGGLEAALSRRRMVDMADLSRSFLARQGKHWAVDFEKLFQAGDLSQNIPLEPGDYLYFPPGGLREVYVLGEVTRPGTVSFESDLTALRAIILQGGFTPQAWKRKVAIIRGSLAHPELIEVNVAAILAASTKDLPLQPRDIVYVSARPWVKVEELLDAAATAFVQSAVVTWTGLHAGPLIR